MPFFGPKSSRRSNTPDGLKRKSHFSGHREKIKVCNQEEVDPLTAMPEMLVLDTLEVVATFKGVVPYSRYANNSMICRTMNVLHTKKWGLLW